MTVLCSSSISSTALFWKCRLNDLALVDNDQFYFTNFVKYHMATEMLFRLPFGSVGFYDGVQAVLIETDLFGPNGIAVSNDGKYVVILYV